MNEREIDKLLPKIAHLYYLEDMNQDQIAERLNLNRVRVSRYLKKAREKKIVEIRINHAGESHHELERSLERRWGLKECVVIPDRESREETYGEIAESLTGLLLRTLKPGDSVGVNWGHTLKEVVALMRTSSRLQVKVVPMVGGLGMIERGIHTNSVARGLADVLGGVSYVINAPAILDSRQTRQVLMGDSNTREIFNLLEELDCAVFSFSDLGPASSHVTYGVFSDRDMRYLRGLGVVGDVNLNFLDARGRPVPNRIGERVIALSVDGIRRIPTRIGVACGGRKTEVARAVLRGGIANMLIVDREIAEGLDRPEPPSPSGAAPAGRIFG